MSEENIEYAGTDEATDRVEEITLDELMELKGASEQQEIVLPPVDLNLNNITGLSLDTAEFQRGLERASEIAGYVTALKNVGLENSVIFELIATEWGIDLNKEISEIQSDTSIEIAKHQSKFEKDNKL